MIFVIFECIKFLLLNIGKTEKRMNFKQLVTSVTFFIALTVTIGSFYSFSILNDGSREAALSAYNAGTALQSTNPQAAIDSLEKAVSIAETLDSNGVDIIEKATKKLPKLYYTVSVGIYKQKDYAGAIKSFEETKEVAVKYENEGIAKKVDKTLPKLYLADGQKKMKAKDFDGAISNFDQAVELNPNYTKAMYMKALALKSKKDFDGALAQYDVAIAKAEELNQTSMVKKSQKSAFNSLKKYGKSLNKKKQYNDAIKYLELAAGKYKPTFKDAATESKKMAGVHFELGNAYAGQGNTSKACAAYKKAAVGQYKQNAEYQMNVKLKCN